METQFLTRVAGPVPVKMVELVTAKFADSLVPDTKRVVVGKFSDHCQKGLFTLKLHPLDHMAQYNKRFDRFQSLDASQFEHFNLAISKYYTTSSLRNVTRTLPRNPLASPFGQQNGRLRYRIFFLRCNLFGSD